MHSPDTHPPEDNNLSRRHLLQLAVGALALTWGASMEDALLAQNSEPGPSITPYVTMEQQAVTHEVSLLHAGAWQYMAGAQSVSGGLELRPTGLGIVDKRNNDRVVSNPPLNVYGARLQTQGDFSVSAHMQSATPASLQLYGRVPLRFDDFRYERARVECTNNGNVLSVRIWDGSEQEPSVVRRFPFEGSPTDRQLEVRRENKELTFVMNGKLVGRIPKGTVFESGQVWFGANSEQGVALMRGLSAKPLNGHKLAVANTASLHVNRPLPEGLQTLVHKQYFRLGGAASLNPLVSDASYAELFLGGELGSITTENALKPQDVQPTEGVFTFGEAEALIQLAERHGLAVHGHALVYDKAMPAWMQALPYATEADKNRARDVLVSHITAVAGHFKGRVASWDVVNEAIAGFNGDVSFEESLWFKALGEEYIDVAFHAAHAADPNALLYINDYGLETNPQGRGQFMLDLAIRLQARGVPIHGVGIQGHVYEIPRDVIHVPTLQQLMSDFHDLGLAVRISELDVTGADGPRLQAQQYADVLLACLTAPNCTGLTVWGLDDGHGSTAKLTIYGRLVTGNALPYTADYRPKLARQAMHDTLRTF